MPEMPEGYTIFDFSIIGEDTILNHPDQIEDIIQKFEETHDARVFMHYHLFPGDIELRLRKDAWSTAAHVPYEKVTEESIVSTLNALYEELLRKENQQA